MRKICLYIITITVFISCKKSTTHQNIEFINGYWEIEKVVLSDGSEKQYNFNQSIDFFNIKDSIGIRKKLQPQLNGSFISTNDSESFTLRTTKDSVHLYYQNQLSNWKETIISIKKDKMIIINESLNKYFYKRFKKIELE